MSSPQTGTPVCPQCRSRNVRKVTEVIDDGTIQGLVPTASGRTALAERLLQGAPQPPAKPESRVSAPGCLIVIGGVAVVFFGSVAIEDINPGPNMVQFAHLYRQDVVVAFIASLGLITLGIMWSVVRKNRPSPEEVRTWSTYRSKLARYQHAHHNWATVLYYCQQCGSQFLPGRAKFTPASSIQDVLDQ